MNAQLSRDTKTAPRSAFAFESSLQFKDAKGDEKQSPEEHRVTVFARTADVVSHWYWGRIIHDMSGMRNKDRIPFDWRHDSDEELGFADTFNAGDDGLTVEGPLQSIEEGDRASKVIKRGRMGQPYEASIYWDEMDPVLEYIDEGFIAEVNGRTVEGPLVIAREWTLKAVAITPHGVDSTTHTQFSADANADSVPIAFQPQTQKPNTEGPVGTKTDTQPTKDAVVPPVDGNTPTKDQVKPEGDGNGNSSAHQDAARGELSRYMKRFGNDRGAEYFRDSVPYADACEREIDTLRKENSDLAEQLKTTKDSLAQVKIGEESPVDTGNPTKDGKPAPTWQGLFKRRGE